MFIRTTSVKIDPATIADFRAEADTVKRKLKLIPGLSHQFTAIGDDGSVLSIGIWESAEAAKAGAESIQAIWSTLGAYLRSPPVVTSYPYGEQLAGPSEEI